MSCGGQAEQVDSSSRTPESSRATAPSQPSASMSKAPRPARPPAARAAGRARPAVGAPDVLVALLLGRQRRAARRAGRRHDELPLGAVAQVDDRPEDLGDDVAGLAQHHGVADEDALAPHLVGVVQRGPLDRGPGDDDRLHDPERGDPAGATDVDLDVEERGVDLLGRVLEGDGPPRRPRGGAELALHRDLVDLDDDPVDLVLDVVPVLARVHDEGLDLLDRVDDPEVVGHRQPPCLRALVGLALPLQLEPLALADAVDEHAQLAARGDARVLLPQRSGRRVARVGEGRLARLDELRVEVAERLDREEHLAAHLDERRHRVVGVARARSGCRSMVRTLCVTSSPVRPSPRVSARVRRPFS